MPVNSPAFATLQNLTPSLEHQQGLWHGCTSLPSMRWEHSPSPAAPFSKAASTVFFGAPATMIYPGHCEDSWLTEVNSFLGFISKRH